jgi:hypothetical protein
MPRASARSVVRVSRQRTVSARIQDGIGSTRPPTDLPIAAANCRLER